MCDELNHNDEMSQADEKLEGTQQQVKRLRRNEFDVSRKAKGQRGHGTRASRETEGRSC